MDPTQPHQNLFNSTPPNLQVGAPLNDSLIAAPQFTSLEDAWLLLSPPHRLAESTEALGRALNNVRRRGASSHLIASLRSVGETGSAATGTRMTSATGSGNILNTTSSGFSSGISTNNPSSSSSSISRSSPDSKLDPVLMDVARGAPTRKRQRDESERELEGPSAGKHSDLGGHAERIRAALPIQTCSDASICEALLNLPSVSAAFLKYDPGNEIVFDGVQPCFSIRGAQPEPQCVLSPGGRFLPGVPALRAALAAWRGDAVQVPGAVAGSPKVTELTTLLESRCVTELAQLEAALDGIQADTPVEQIRNIIKDAGRLLQSLDQARAWSRELENYWRGLAGTAERGSVSGSFDSGTFVSSSFASSSFSSSSSTSSVSIPEPESRDARDAARNAIRQTELGRVLDEIVPGLEFEIQALRLQYPPPPPAVDMDVADIFDADPDVMMDDGAPPEAEQAGGIFQPRQAAIPPGTATNLPFFPWALEQRLLRQDSLAERDSKSSAPRVETNIIRLLTAARDADKAQATATWNFDAARRDLLNAKRARALQRVDNLSDYTKVHKQARESLDAARRQAVQTRALVREIPCFATINYPEMVDLALWEQEADQEQSLVQLRGKVDRFPSAGSEPARFDMQAGAIDASHAAIDARRQMARPRADFLAAATALFEHGMGAVSAYVAATQRFNDALHDCALSFIRARMLWKDLARDFQIRKPDAAIPEAVVHVIEELGQYADEVISQWRTLQREQLALASVPRQVTGKSGTL